jgi:hypothetical protein
METDTDATTEDAVILYSQYKGKDQQPGSHELQESCGSSWVAAKNLLC